LARQLSGGNQQKLVLAKWLMTQARVLILDEPTRGVDVATKVEIYQIIGDLASQGMGILLISSELPEILGMCDRALVMRNGGIVAEFTRTEASEEKLLAAAAGVTP
jgi:ABC-type sugar transport system ATPase subunit